MFYEDPPEYATLPDDVEYQLSQSFANFISATAFATMMIVWSSYHALAILRTGHILKKYNLYRVIYNCELYISLYAVAKFVLLCNPLWVFHYRREIRVCTTLRRRHGVTHE